MRRNAPEVWVEVIGTIEVLTQKALLLNGEDEDGEMIQEWVPRSQCRNGSGISANDKKVVMKEWIAKDKGFAYTEVAEDGKKELTGRLNFGSYDCRDDDEIPF